MNAWNLAFDPMIDWAWLLGGGALVLVLTLFGMWRGQRGSLFRGLTLAFLLVFLSQPLLVEENRNPVDDITLVVVDDSASQNLQERTNLKNAALDELQARLADFPNLETRIIRGGKGSQSEGLEDGTQLFSKLDSALIDMDAKRLAGVIVLSDGQIHDAPSGQDQLDRLPPSVPVHGLLTGKKREVDRKLVIVSSPRFAIVGETFPITIRVDDMGRTTEEKINTIAPVTVRIDGKVVYRNRIFVNRDHVIDNVMELGHGGENIIEVNVGGLSGELTEINNRAAVLVNGIRDRLRVLLVSGEPHAGERVWRNLLKSDPSVDLVHFTILRPPEKQDGTPIGELSLIAFPTRQLFSIKLYEFDLIIFDRYRRRGVLPLLYLNNIAEFVERGGALLTAAGPPFASPYSLYRTPLSSVLPSRPTGDILTGGFRPQVTDLGDRHPVTAKLEQVRSRMVSGAQAEDDLSDEPNWGRWFRLIDSVPIAGHVVMSGANDKPLLILDRVGEGRVAQLMSDHAWLWARGYDSGGPQAELLRRLAHWLMKEPDLEEETLSGEAKSGDLVIERRTMSDSVAPVAVRAPSGEETTVDLRQSQPGVWRGSVPVSEIGLHQLSDGERSVAVAVGPLNPKEYEDVRATEEKLAPVAAHTGGRLHWLAPEDGRAASLDLPSVRRVNADRDLSGRDWIGLRRNNEYTVRSLININLILAPIALLILSILLLTGWFREGRS